MDIVGKTKILLKDVTEDINKYMLDGNVKYRDNANSLHITSKIVYNNERILHITQDDDDSKIYMKKYIFYSCL